MLKKMWEISEFLTNNMKQDANFYVEGEVPSAEINVTANGIGKLNFPCNEEMIKKLITVSSKAKFGLGDETLFDLTVRDTQEIKIDKLNVIIKGDTLCQMLTCIRRGLGFPEKTILEPCLYNMLIYGPYQFFEEHQDTEKIEGMIASLVLVLPSSHYGGDLIINHHEDAHYFCSEDMASDVIKYIAFYSDCYHRVKSVKNGYRVVLTYNLIVVTTNIFYADYKNFNLEKMFEEYFKITEPDIGVLKFIYFLDYTYTEHSLKWNLLKGADIKRGLSLYNISRHLNLIPRLVLTECVQIAGEGYIFEDTKINEQKVYLDFWIGLNNEKLPYEAYHVDPNLIHIATEVKNFKPYFETVRYTGNEGDTVDFRYRMAGIVLWPLTNNTFMRFIIDYNNVKNELLEMIKFPSKQEYALKIIRQVGNNLYRSGYDDEKNYFNAFVDFVIQINDKKIAEEILLLFTWEVLNLDIAECLLKLKSKYENSFIFGLLHKWNDRRKVSHALKHFSKIVSGFINYDLGKEFIQFLLKSEWSSTTIDDLAYIDGKQYNYSMHDHVIRIKELLKACEIIIADYCVSNIKTLIIDHLISNTCTLYSIHDLAEMFLELCCIDSFTKSRHYKIFKDHIISVINRNRLLSYRSEDNWSIDKIMPCQCRRCLALKKFLLSKNKVKEIWFVDGAVGNHLELIMKTLKIPVRVSINYLRMIRKITLTKTIQLHNASKKEFDKLNSYLNNLQFV